MKVYRLKINNSSFSTFFLPDEEQKTYLEEVSKKKSFYTNEFSLSDWKPIVILENNVRLKPDFTMLEDEFFIISENANQKLKCYVSNFINLLPVLNDVTTYYILRCTNIIDVLDKSKSLLKKLPFSTKVIRILYHEFESNKIENELIFKIPEIQYDVFVTEKFRKLCLDLDLKGLDFDDVVWES